MRKEDFVFEIIQDLFVSTVLTTVASLINGGIPPISVFLPEIGFAWLVNLAIGLAVPEKKIGGALCSLLRVPEKAGFFVVMAVIVVINVVGISACVVLKNVGPSPMFLPVWASLQMPLMLAGYLAALAFFPLAGKITKFICKEKERGCDV